MNQIMYPQYPMEHFSFDAFMNMSREMTGLDNRRRDWDKNFTNAGTQIKALTKQCLDSYGTSSFEDNIISLVRRLHKWYYEESPSGELVQRNTRQIDYKQLHNIGVEITPQEGKMLSHYKHNNPGMQKIRDSFINGLNELDKGNDEPIIKWWLDYEVLFRKNVKDIPVPVRQVA